MSTSVTDESAFRDPKIRNAAIAIGRSKQRLAVFNAIYFGKTKIKTQEFIRVRAGLANTKRVLEEGKKLATERIVNQVKYRSETAYEKIDFYYKNKAAINSLVLRYTTGKIDLRANPQTGHIEIHIKQRLDGSAKHITVDDIDSFRKVRKVKRGKEKRYYESEIKDRLKYIITEGGKFKDWGGETNNIYTNRLIFKRRRRATAFALKGKGTMPPLTPKKMVKMAIRFPG
jgi:hypothetical protein